MEVKTPTQNNIPGLQYILQHVTGRPYENRTPKMIQDEFLNNCGGLVANTNENRKSFVKNNPKIRFLVVGMGLMACGKTSGFKEARNYCKLINASAYNKPWESIDSGTLSIDNLVTNSENYKDAVATIFQNYTAGEFEEKEPWTQFGWNQWRKPNEKQVFLEKIAEAYNIARQGKEDDGEVKSAKEISLDNLHTAILEDKNIEYETIGARFDTLKSILQMIVESTYNCKNKYVYIVLGVLNLCSIQESYNQQLCRFFAKSEPFYQAMVAGDPLPAAPRIGVSATTQQQNISIYGNMINLIKVCNSNIIPEPITLSGRQIRAPSTYNDVYQPAIYKGVCLGFGIDILLVSYNPPRIKGTQQNKFNKLIATLPLSVRSRSLIKSTKSNKSILNSKFYHDLVIYILEQLTNKARFGKNPVDFAAINCNSPTIFQDVNLLVNDFISGWSINYSKKTIDAFENIRNTVRSVNPAWTKSLKLGGKRRRRKKTKRRRKKKGKKRKTRRKRKR